MLSHTGGLSTHGFPGHDIKGPVPTVIQVLDGKTPAVTPAVRSQFEPGLRFQYSGGGTTISQLILTDVTGKNYDEWMYENVLKPIGMVHSAYAQPPAKDMWKLCATAYRDGVPLENKFHVYPEQGAAGLWMTPSDLSNYIIDMQLAYKGNASKVLNAEMVKLHLTPYLNNETAMGTFIEDRNGANYFQHGAANDGFCGQFYGSLDDGYGVVIFLNTEYSKILWEVIKSVAKAYDWKNFYQEPKRRNSVNVDEKTIQSYEGIYVFENNWASIGKKDNAFHFFADGIYAQMHFTSPTHFFSEEFGSEKDMLIDEKGNVTGYKRTVNGKEFPPSIKITNTDTLKLELRQFNDIGWYFIENKNYGKALSYFNRGTQVYPKDLNIQMNTAHAYLFNNNYDKAIAIYKSHLGEEIKPGFIWQDLVRDDYMYFRDHNYNVKDFDKVFTELKMKKP